MYVCRTIVALLYRQDLDMPCPTAKFKAARVMLVLVSRDLDFLFVSEKHVTVE